MREHPENAGPSLGEYCLLHESGVPDSVRVNWRSISISGLVEFLKCRYVELVDGGEGVFSMTGGGTEDGEITYLSDFEVRTRDMR
jgi:hypothetical protein